MTLPKCLIFMVFLSLTKCISLNNLIVQTRNGAVQGRERSSVESKRPFYSFQGIPYAEPPIDELRFEPPVPVSDWEDVLDATEDRGRCIQGSDPVEGSEDCLFLNVYTPKIPSESCELLPTMVWIHGGGFEGGDSSYELYGPDHLLEKDIVIVTLNYRLGFLGFLSTGDSVVPGNNGLKDQVLALKWVKDNIKSFCGNPDQITIAGQSAGAASVAYHVQSPLSRGLFHQAILQSGTSLSLWTLAREVPQVVNSVAQQLGIDNSSSQAIINGLRTINSTQLQTTASSVVGTAYLNSNPRDGLILGPVSEPDLPGAFFTGKSHEKLANGDFAKVPLLMGFNSLEGTYQFEILFRLYLVKFDLNPELLLPIDFNVATNKRSVAAREIKNYYFKWFPVSLSTMQLMRFLSDDQFVRASREFARLVQKEAPVYFYRFSYEGGLWGNYNRTTSGVSHSEELGYTWVSKHEPEREHDLEVKARMITLWTNFIKKGNPTPTKDPLLQNVSWTPLSENLNYLDIGEDLVLSQSPEKGNMEFWDNFAEKYGNPPYGTY